MATLIARVSAVIAYTDGSVGSIATAIDDKGNLSYNGQPVARQSAVNAGKVDSLKNTGEVKGSAILDPGTNNYLDAFYQWQSLIDWDRGCTTLTDKTVKSMNFDFVGRVSMSQEDWTAILAVVGESIATLPYNTMPTSFDFRFAYDAHKQDDGTIIGGVLDVASTYVIEVLGAVNIPAALLIIIISASADMNDLSVIMKDVLNPVGLDFILPPA